MKEHEGKRKHEVLKKNLRIFNDFEEKQKKEEKKI